MYCCKPQVMQQLMVPSIPRHEQLRGTNRPCVHAETQSRLRPPVHEHGDCPADSSQSGFDSRVEDEFAKISSLVLSDFTPILPLTRPGFRDLF